MLSLFIGILFNCFLQSEIKANETLSEVGHGEYFTSSKYYLDNDKEFLIPIIRGYDYLIISENSNDSEPKLLIDYKFCNESYSKITTEKDDFVFIELKETSCTTLIISFKKNEHYGTRE